MLPTPAASAPTIAQTEPILDNQDRCSRDIATILATRFLLAP
jgi:hypothetical protein